MKYTFKDFTDGKINLHVSEAEWPAFAYRCKEAGMRWSDDAGIDPRDNCGGILPLRAMHRRLNVISSGWPPFVPVVSFSELALSASAPRSITITFDGTDTTASLYVGDDLSQSAMVKLLPGDDDSEYAKVCRAISRLYGHKPIDPRILSEAANDLFAIAKSLQAYAGKAAKTR